MAVKTLGLIWIFSWLLGSATGRLILAVLVLWYLDNRYFGLVAALWAPIARTQRIGALRRTVAINPSEVGAMVELGEHYLRAGRPRLSADYLQQAIDRGEDSARALYLLGAAQVRLGEYAVGRPRLESALQQAPNVAYGEPLLYILESVLSTSGAQSPEVEELVDRLEQFDSVEILTRAGQLCGAAGRTDLARRLLEEAVRNYGFVPPGMRRRQRRWMVRARFGLLQFR